MGEQRVERRLAAILAADVVGYSRLMGCDEAGTLARLKALRADLVDPAIAGHHGRIVKLMGDGVLAEFASVVDAVACAVEIQRGVAGRDAELAPDQRLAFRIGINLGDVIVEGDDLYGDGVNVAARLEGLAEPGGICISRTVRDHVRDKLPLALDDLGEHRVKNIARPVRVFRVSAAAGGPERAVRPRKAGLFRRRTVVPVAAVLVVALVSALFGWLRPWQAGPEGAADTDLARPLPDRPSLAVLPFSNFGGQPDQEYFADGLTDDLITDLSKVSGLFVIARNSVFTYKSRAVDIREVARALGVRYVLEGSVRRAGDRVRINAQLIDGETGSHLWAERYDRPYAEIFALQDDVIRHIVGALAVELTATEQSAVTRLPTDNLEAYDYYLRAEQAARTGFRPQLREALSLYRQASALDPGFAEAFAADARTAAYVMRNNYDDVLPGPVARKRAYEHAGRALEIDPKAALPFAVLAVLQVVDGRHEEALASAERAVALGPSDAEAHAARALVLTFSGRHADAAAAIEGAMRLNPSLPTSDRIVAGLAFLLNGAPERAIEVLERARAEAPDVDDTHAMLAAAYARAGQVDAARRAAAEAVRLAPNLCTQAYRVVFAHFRDERDLEQVLDAMRAAGLPEWPWGFTADAADRLSAAEINRLAFGRTWHGRLEGGEPALAQIEPDGGMAFRTTTYIATGTAFVAGDMLCERIEVLSLGRPVCGPVYRRAQPPGEDGDGLAYTYANASKVFHFSPAE